MVAESAEIVVVGPSGGPIASLALSERVTVGRLPELNDIALEPDPELFVSRNTVKSQVLSIYRKLGVSSRSMAVDRARDLGLLEG